MASKKELIQIAKDNGLEASDEMLKREIVDLLEEHGLMPSEDEESQTDAVEASRPAPPLHRQREDQDEAISTPGRFG